MSFNLSDIYIIIPSYNEGDRIRKVIKSVKEKGFENIIVVDDGSTDNSIEQIMDLNPIILRHLVNRGAGAATETGLQFCREIINPVAVVMLDADTQHDADDIGKLVTAHFESDADITIGNRFIENSANIPFKNRFYNKVANIITSIFAGRKVSDSQSGFKVFNRRALHSIIIEQERFEHCSEIFIKAHEHNLKVIDVPIKVYYIPEIDGKGQNLSTGVRTFINLLHSALFKNK